MKKYQSHHVWRVLFAVTTAHLAEPRPLWRVPVHSQDHINHVNTQLPYAMLVAAVSFMKAI